MGLRLASVRHSNVVMAPALTETVQSQSFKFATSPSRSPSLSLKNHQKKAEIIREELEPKLTNGLKYTAGMNGHSPPNNKTTYSINGLAKNLKNEFLPLNRKKDVIKDETGNKADSNYSITQIGGYMMNSGFMGDPDMGLRKSNKDINEGEKVSPEVDQFIKNLIVMNSEELGANSELNQNVEEIFKVISNLDNNTSNDLVSGPSGESEPMFSDMGALSNFERDLFNDVDVMNMCVDESLVTVNKDAVIRERIEEFRKRKFLLWRRIEFLVRRLKKTKAHILGRHAAEEITGVIEYTSNLLEASSRLRIYSSGDGADSNVPCEVKPVSFSGLSLFMRQMDHAVNQQTNTVARNSIRQCKYFGSGSSSNSLVSTSNGVRSSLPGSILPSFPSEAKQELTVTYGELHSQLVKLQQDIDSDVTESSSGCESCDEFINYNNAHQHPLSISKRASWKWAEERALIAAKWTWLQSQIADLEYRIRQHTDIRRQVRSAKGSVKFQGEAPSTHNLPNGCNSEKGENSCSRTRGLITGSFGKRRILQLSGLHRTSKKAARSAGLRCSCNTNLPGCGLCTSRSEPGQPPEPISTLPVNHRVAYLDPGFHPALSFPHDVSASVHYDAVMKCTDWQNRASRIQGKASLPGEEKTRGRPTGNNEHHVVDLQRSKAAALAVSVKLRRKIVRGRRRRRNASLNLENFRQRRKHSTGLSSIDSEEGVEQDIDANNSIRYPSPAPSPAPTQHSGTPISKDKETIKRKRENSYDIDNIVIPYSMASATRLEKLNYKEILTPKWRRIIKSEHRENSLDQKNNGIIRRSSHDTEGEEDISEEAAINRHDRCEVDEKKKFLSYLKLPNSGMGRGRGQRRTDSRADSSGPNTPDGMSPRDDGAGAAEDSLASPPPTPSDNETTRKRTISSSQQIQLPEVSPYEPRVFPLSDEAYRKMIEESKESQHYPVTISSFQQQNPSGPKSPGSVSTDSAESFLGEDPNDPEWTTVDRSNCKR